MKLWCGMVAMDLVLISIPLTGQGQLQALQESSRIERRSPEEPNQPLPETPLQYSDPFNVGPPASFLSTNFPSGASYLSIGPTNWLFWSTNSPLTPPGTNSPRGPFKPAPVLSPPLTATNGTPQPGIYVSKPYTCIIRVPGHGPDQAMAKSPPPAHDHMPMIIPELRLEPRGAK